MLRLDHAGTLAFKPTTEREEEGVEEYAGLLVDHSIYEKPTRILFLPLTEAEDETEISRKSMPQPDQEMTNGSRGRDQSADGSHLTKEDQRSVGTPFGDLHNQGDCISQSRTRSTR